MIKSMTGFSRVKGFIPRLGRIGLEIRSTNHRFLDIALGLPEDLMHLEQKFKQEIGRQIRRGHIFCRLEVNVSRLRKPVLNNRLIEQYYHSLKKISRQLRLKSEININTLATLPGVWAIEPHKALRVNWHKIRPILKEALNKLVQRRQQEGQALYQDLLAQARRLRKTLTLIKTRFNSMVASKLRAYKTEEEQNGFLKSSNINEEIVRLSFHIKNFIRCLKNKQEVGKELDFILQEMQREANTIGAKSIDTLISRRVVSIKSEIEKMREQVQNVE